MTCGSRSRAATSDSRRNRLVNSRSWASDSGSSLIATRQSRRHAHALPRRAAPWGGFAVGRFGVPVWRTVRTPGRPVKAFSSAIRGYGTVTTVFEGLHHAQLTMPPGEEDTARGFFVGVLGMAEIAKPPVLAARGGAWFRA